MIQIIEVKIVGLCSKHRNKTDEVPKNIYGVPYIDEDISCVECAFEETEVKE